MIRLFLIFFILLIATVDSQEQTTCTANQFFNGQSCTCASGYFAESSDEAKSRCEHECDEIYFSFFTFGTCVKVFSNKTSKDKLQCNMRCGIRIRLWTSIGIFCVFAASIATLIFTLPTCIATCASCLHSKKASKHSKRAYVETQQQQISKEQQLQTLSYNPYAYWPYYGRA